MHAIAFPGQDQTRVIEKPAPTPGPAEVTLQVLRTALCGSDIKLWHKGASFVPGHEIFGVVRQAGHSQDGQRCLVYMPVHCGHCASCEAGDTHLCLSESTLIGWNRDGGYAQALAVPESCLMPVPDDVDDDSAPLLLDTIGTAAHGLRNIAPLLAQPARASVLILGAGPIGLGALIAAQQMGYQHITVAEPRAPRAALAQRLGARLAEAGETQTRYQLVIESSGNLAARNQALTVVLPRGVVLLLGENDNPWVIEETKPIRRKDFFMARSFYFPKGDYAANLALLRARRSDYRSLVDTSCDLAGFATQFARFAAGELIKPLLAPTSQGGWSGV